MQSVILSAVPTLASTVLAASLVPTTAAGHRFWEESDPDVRAQQQLQFVKNVSMLGGLLLAAVDTEGKPGVAWRAKHAVGSAKREAKQRFAEWLKRATGDVVDPESIFDTQIKRIHEYKRQLLNALHVVVLYRRLRDDPNLTVPPRTFAWPCTASMP